MSDLFIALVSLLLGYVLAIPQHGRENILQSRLMVLEDENYLSYGGYCLRRA